MCPERRLYVQPNSYAYVFAYELKKAWRLDRQAAPVVDRVLIPVEAAKVSSHRYLASIKPLNGAGAVAFRTAHAQADAIVAAAQRRAA